MNSTGKTLFGFSIMSDRSIDLMAGEQAPYMADNVLNLDAHETYRLLISLQEVFKQETNQ